MSDKKFTIDVAIAYQTEHLKMWSKVLKKEVFVEVCQEAGKRNAEVFLKDSPNPDDIWRGVDIDAYIRGLASKLLEVAK